MLPLTIQAAEAIEVVHQIVDGLILIDQAIAIQMDDQVAEITVEHTIQVVTKGLHLHPIDPTLLVAEAGHQE